MDTQVFYIILLFVVTVICIGVSAGVKYDKSTIETHPDMPHAHSFEDDEQSQQYSSLSQENKNKVKIINSQQSLPSEEQKTISTPINNTQITVNSNGKTIKSSGPMTLDHFNNLFVSESINNTQAKGPYYLYGQSSIMVKELNPSSNTYSGSTLPANLSGLKIELDKKTGYYNIETPTITTTSDTTSYYFYLYEYESSSVSSSKDTYYSIQMVPNQKNIDLTTYNPGPIFKSYKTRDIILFPLSKISNKNGFKTGSVDVNEESSYGVKKNFNVIKGTLYTDSDQISFESTVPSTQSIYVEQGKFNFSANIGNGSSETFKLKILPQQQFSFDNSGFLMFGSKYIIMLSQDIEYNNYCVLRDSPLSASGGDYALKLVPSESSSYPFLLMSVQILTTPKKANFYNLEYFGLTTNTELPPPENSKYSYINNDSSLSEIPQSPPEMDNLLGLFAMVRKSNASPTASTPGTPNDFIGFTSSIKSYSISVLNSTPFNSSTTLIKNLPSNTAKYEIPSSGQPFYSIHTLNLESSNTTKYTINDRNDVEGVQNVLVIYSPNSSSSSSPRYNLLERGGTTDLTTEQVNTDVLQSQKQLYNIIPEKNFIQQIIFFPLYYKGQPYKNGSLTMTGPKINTSSPGVSTYKSQFQYAYQYSGTPKVYTQYILSDDSTWNST